jgi:hypothetical protein
MRWAVGSEGESDKNILQDESPLVYYLSSETVQNDVCCVFEMFLGWKLN